MDATYDIGDYVLIRWNHEIYLGTIISVSEEAAFIKSMEKRIKSWRWPTIKDEQLYPWTDFLQKIKPPKLIRRECYSVREIDQLRL